MKRLVALNEELIKELIPEIGLRAGFINSWKQLIVKATQGKVLFIYIACTSTSCYKLY